MNNIVPTSYQGPPLSSSAKSLMVVLASHGFECRSTGVGNKTLNIYHDGQRCAYVNSTTLRYHGVVGYHFGPWGRNANDSPSEFIGHLSEEFQRRYGCMAKDIVIQNGAGSNKGRQYLIIINPTVALKVLYQDIGATLDESVYVTQVKGKFVEGRICEVVVSKAERSRAARQCCLDTYGYDCFVCKVNIRTKYGGLKQELIHVHHEDPLSSRAGERETDAVAGLKPVCPNCHAVIHSREPPYSVEEVRRMLDGQT